MDSALRASLRLSKIAPGDFVTAFNPGYETHGIHHAARATCWTMPGSTSST
jgi:hypothetical protein